MKDLKDMKTLETSRKNIISSFIFTEAMWDKYLYLRSRSEEGAFRYLEAVCRYGVTGMETDGVEYFSEKAYIDRGKLQYAARLNMR